MNLELRGDIPGLLRRTSPVYGVYTMHLMDPPPPDAPGFRGVVMEPPDSDGCVAICEDKSWASMAPWAEDTVLDMADPTGRLHARLWLAERGHPTEEDRAEVLAWSVLSVLRGGKALRGVAGPWLDIDAARRKGGCCSASWERWGRQRPGSDGDTPLLGCVQAAKPEWEEDAGWMVQPLGSFSRSQVPHGPESGDAGKAACDAALLRLGWALTNPDGSLTLPPLPGAA